ncbi:hypothetical protein ACQR1I_24000 [Bradyrhizobium sp. HKCCYLS2038]|uniref:hypothetical protein n=1 Tax=unclassified Bradyrhizobium TaxID=2631580 RepID=UPI003EC0821A
MNIASSIIHKLIASLAVALTLVARPCLGGEPTIVDTPGFSVTFGAMWHVQTDHKGTILGSVGGEEPPFIVMYYEDQVTVAVRGRGHELERMERSSIADMIGDGLPSMIDGSTWHRHEIVHRPDGMIVEQLDLAADARDKDGRAIATCSFLKFYHGAPRAELYLGFIMNKPCDDARADFDGFEKSISWK